MTGVSTFGGLSTALRGLMAQQRALDVTAHNIANVETPGYSRQEAVLTAALPHTIPGGAIHDGAGAQLGQGVDVLQYRRSREAFLDLQQRAATMDLGQQAALAQKLGEVEAVLGEPSDTGVGAMLGKFWSAWEQFASNPANSAAKAGVLGAAQNLASSLNRVAGGIATVQTNAAGELTALTGTTGPVQPAFQQIAQLNGSISAAINAGQSPNDLLDRRDALLDQLSAYGTLTVTDAGSGAIDVALDGQPIVTGTAFAWPGTFTATSGRLGALASIANPAGPLGQYGAALDTVATTLGSAVNALQPTPLFTGTSATTFAVAAGANPVASSTAVGDNTLARQIAALRGGTADTSFADLVQRIGADADTANRGETVAKAVLAAADERRQAVQGVALDEEMTNMVRFQRGYQAAARMMSTMDEALDTLINRTGRVGL